MGLPRGADATGLAFSKLRRQGHIRIGVQVDHGVGSRFQNSAIGFAHQAIDRHFIGIEDADQRRAPPKLIAFLRVAHGVIAPNVFLGHHAVQWRLDFEFIHVALGAFQGHFLPVALQFQNAERGGIGLIVKRVGFLEAVHMRARDGGLLFILQAIDFAQQRAFAELDFGLGQIGLGLLQIGVALFGVGAVLGALLIGLVAQIVELGAGVAGFVDLVGGIEGSDGIALFDW